LIKQDPGNPSAVLIAIKAVPGSRRDQVVGRLGDRLKIKVAAPPEDGRANEAICTLLARELGVRHAAVTIISGHTRPEKVVRVEGISPESLRDRW
jgi:uncharacterized protein (TIGR00251 family)